VLCYRSSLNPKNIMPVPQEKIKNSESQSSMPEQPREVLGLDTKALLHLGEVAATLDFLPASASATISKIPDATRVVPLVERMHSGAELTAKDVDPYKAAIVRLSPSLKASKNIEADFQKQTKQTIEFARKKVKELGLEEHADLLATFENPREQFVGELNDVAQRTYSSIEGHRDLRSLRARAAAKNQAPTAYDAGAGISEMLKLFASNAPEAEEQYPILSSILRKLPLEKLPSPKRLALLAPEILEFVFSAVPHDARYEKMLESVHAQPHRLRFLASFMRNVSPIDIKKAQFWAKNLLPAVRDVLPTDGSKLREGLAKAAKILGEPERKQHAPEQREAFANRRPLYFSGGFMHDTLRNEEVMQHLKSLGYDTISALPNVDLPNADTNFVVTVKGGTRPVTVSRKDISYLAHKPYIETSVSAFQKSRAGELIRSLETGKGAVNAIFQSADALNGLLAAYERPDLFNSVILAYPAGLAKQPSVLRSAPRVIRGAMATKLHKLRTPADESFENRASSEINTIRRRDSGGFTTATSVAMSSQSILLHELRGKDNAPHVALVLGVRDHMMPPERIIASLKSSQDVDRILIVDTPHGINGDRKTMNEVLELFPAIEQDQRPGDRQGGVAPLVDRIDFSPSVPPKRRAQILQLAAQLDAKSHDTANA